jgi:cation diffusion facilitator family transporter
MNDATVPNTRDCHASLHVAAHARERSARWVVALTFVMMLIELGAGYATRSMALTADGWHMATHAGALGLSAVAYWFARSRAHDRAFAFGTGKVHALAGYTNAVVLMIVAVAMIVESIERFVTPAVIRFDEALPVAIVGLVVNLVSIKLLEGGSHRHTGHEHEHAHDDEHEHQHQHEDHNHRAAYMHVVADALTSVLAIGALLVGKYLGWKVLDPAMGVLGGVIVLKWGIGLCRSAGRQLVDATSVANVEDEVRLALEGIDDVRVADLHVWEISPGRRGVLAALYTSSPREARFYRQAVEARGPFAHVTIEVHRVEPHALPQT